MNSYKKGIMKKSVILLAALIMIPLNRINGQNQNFEKFSSYKIGFFTKKMNLSPEEAEKFWPVYNEYQKQKMQIQREKIGVVRDFNQNESTLTDSQLTEMGDKLIKCISDESTLAVSFHKKIKEILAPGKIIRYYQAENQYKIQLLKELQENKQQRRGNSDPEF
jgi:hypothetical protein